MSWRKRKRGVRRPRGSSVKVESEAGRISGKVLNLSKLARVYEKALKIVNYSYDSDKLNTGNLGVIKCTD